MYLVVQAFAACLKEREALKWVPRDMRSCCRACGLWVFIAGLDELQDLVPEWGAFRMFRIHVGNRLGFSGIPWVCVVLWGRKKRKIFGKDRPPGIGTSLRPL